jgi:hypothetical protein
MAAFGPYLLKSMGLRLEHVVIYAVGCIGIVKLATTRERRPVYVGPVLAFFGVAALWALIVTFAQPIYEADTVRVFTDLDHYLRPPLIAIAVVAWIGSSTYETEAATASLAAMASLRRLSRIVIALLVVNTVITALSVFFDLGSLLEVFRPLSSAASPNVADRAALGGRFTGIFNQPFEAGVAYSLGLFCWAYLYIGRQARRPYAMAHVSLALLMFGGLLPVSKVFIFAGLPMFLVSWLLGGGLGAALRLRTLPIVVLLVYAFALALATWPGSDLLTRLPETVTGDGDVVTSLSAGRFGNEGLVSQAFRSAATEVPLTGFGLASYGPLDNAYFMFFIHGGAVPLLGYLALICWLALSGLRAFASSAEGRGLVLLVILIAGAGLGAPVASIPRASTVLWSIVTLLLVAIYRDQSHSYMR